MARLFTLLISLSVFMITSVACSDDFNEFEEYRGIPVSPVSAHDEDSVKYGDVDIWKRHHTSTCKVLAIGNSFTHNATLFLPWLLNILDGDSVCIAKITKSGCTLKEHWESHCLNMDDYKLYYSDQEQWELSEISTLDDALTVLDWDIIVIQQASGYSGKYSSYQPWLDNLVRLFHETNPNAKIAWHSTWAYKDGTDHPFFEAYDCDSEKMYQEIMEASDKACENMDYRIPAGTLIKRMREEYTEVEDQFSVDGYHIASDLASHALSSLWYEVLLRPATNHSSLTPPHYPDGLSEEQLSRANKIINLLIPAPEDQEDKDYVDMIFQ